MPPTTLEGRLITPDHCFDNAQLTLDAAGVITAVEEIPGQGENYLIPGFVDLHNHGGNAGAFPTGTTADCQRAAKFHRSHGTTTLLASLVSATGDEMAYQVQRLAPLVDEGLIAGIHLEGPFINPGLCGAQNPEKIMPGNPEVFARVIDASGGNVRSITFAPETDNAFELLQLCAQHNVIASLGHAAASFDETTAVIERAVELGVTVTATHLFNAMPPVHHRDPATAGALIAAARKGLAHLEIIGDGVHLADGTVDMLMNTGNAYGFAVTDAMEAAGLDDGAYILGSLPVTVAGGVARLTTTTGTPGAIAGGTTTLREQFLRFAARHTAAEAVAYTSTNAARVLGGPPALVGNPANLVCLAPNGTVVSVHDYR
ncbi:N-acetylglucosamine-6-phosphate deacetylase [Corynebacterium phocae]|uniref:N-acetylglucosamine-6-phosphate deacetylase n=1 Tax=Corynebacterium phocae TaxID=161895 RepID=A0A1L7D2E4_9CORY|nr:amidohydrolase family protein [Corynebacterium phocae]APT92243.1 N-acetylglucosamine-6-phosphate deacetylase [Corynebacterium phocae]KAA8725384.1 amidohydrolase family protein [Corynebacterium phocae]